MFVLHVGLEVKAGEGPALERDFLGPFTAAISAQPGFKAVALLRPDGGGDYLLSIAFESQALQQQWVATDLHGEVWPIMESHLAGFTLKTFTTV